MSLLRLKKCQKSFLQFRIDDSIQTVNFIALNDESESKDYKNVIKITTSIRQKSTNR